MHSTNMTAGEITATSQESPLLRTDSSGLWQFLKFLWLFLTLRLRAKFLDTAVHERIDRFFYTPLLRRQNS